MIDRADIDAFGVVLKASVMPMNGELSVNTGNGGNSCRRLKLVASSWKTPSFASNGGAPNLDRQDKYNCALLFKGLRVYAVDFDPDGQHTNKVGIGRPWYKKRFGPGAHEHTCQTMAKAIANPSTPLSRIFKPCLSISASMPN